MCISLEDCGIVEYSHRDLWPLRHSNMAATHTTYHTHSHDAYLQISYFNKDLNGNALQISPCYSTQVVWQPIWQNQPSQIPILVGKLRLKIVAGIFAIVYLLKWSDEGGRHSQSQMVWMYRELQHFEKRACCWRFWGDTGVGSDRN